MDFIIRQQAQFHADLQRHHEEWVKEEKVLKSGIVQLIELARIESERLESQKDAIARLDRILNRQSPPQD